MITLINMVIYRSPKSVVSLFGYSLITQEIYGISEYEKYENSLFKRR